MLKLINPKKVIRKAKILHYKKIFEESKNNMKKTWDTIFELIGKTKSKQEFPDFFMKDGKKIIGNENISNSFNDFFSSIGSQLASKIDNSQKQFHEYLENPVKDNFVFCKVTPTLIEEIAKTIKSKNSYGAYLISPKLL